MSVRTEICWGARSTGCGEGRAQGRSLGTGRRGSLTVEAALLLPLVLLMLLSFGFFVRVQLAWENLTHCAVDESGYAASMAWDGIHGLTAKERIKNRLKNEQGIPSSWSVEYFFPDHRDGTTDHVTTYLLTGSVPLDLPAGFSRSFTLKFPVKYRNFVGRQMEGDPLGDAGLETDAPEDPVVIFPAMGERYHRESCRYVSASVQRILLTSSVRSTRKPCEVCHSEDLPLGSTVFCFEGKTSAWHRSTCRTITRHVAVIDRSEAVKKGYTPCKVCGGSASGGAPPAPAAP